MTSTDHQFSAGTVNDGAQDTNFLVSPTFDPAGKKSGHGTVAWLPAPDYDMPRPDPWTGSGGPVIALLDSAVDKGHPWLPPASDLFVTDAKTDLDWAGPDLPATGPEDDGGDLGSHLIHGTFIAGLIRYNAPQARILSMPVMNIHGKVDQQDVISALGWLTDNVRDEPVNVVLMAFGTPADPGDGDLAHLKKAICALGSRLSNVQFVASAGNNASDRTVYPAAFAADQDLRDNGVKVASVGAVAVGAPTERARYSNYGPWVTEWRNGTNIISLAPLTTAVLDDTRAGLVPYTVADTGHGYAWWSGTSFAAAKYAAEVAQGMSPAAGAPKPAAGS
jgi:hypothetical protein